MPTARLKDAILLCWSIRAKLVNTRREPVGESKIVIGGAAYLSTHRFLFSDELMDIRREDPVYYHKARLTAGPVGHSGTVDPIEQLQLAPSAAFKLTVPGDLRKDIVGDIHRRDDSTSGVWRPASVFGLIATVLGNRASASDNFAAWAHGA